MKNTTIGELLNDDKISTRLYNILWRLYRLEIPSQTFDNLTITDIALQHTDDEIMKCRGMGLKTFDEYLYLSGREVEPKDILALNDATSQKLLTVKELKKLMRKLPDDMPVIVPLTEPGNSDDILAFRNVITVGVLACDGEDDALILNSSLNNLDISDQLERFRKLDSRVTVVEVLK